MVTLYNMLVTYISLVIIFIIVMCANERCQNVARLTFIEQSTVFFTSIHYAYTP